jgi:hypothetical protein
MLTPKAPDCHISMEAATERTMGKVRMEAGEAKVRDLRRITTQGSTEATEGNNRISAEVSQLLPATRTLLQHQQLLQMRRSLPSLHLQAAQITRLRRRRIQCRAYSSVNITTEYNHKHKRPSSSTHPVRELVVYMRFALVKGHCCRRRTRCTLMAVRGEDVANGHLKHVEIDASQGFT